MQESGFVKRPEGPWKPRELLGFAESYAIRVRRTLSDMDARGLPPGESGHSWRDAVELASLIEQLAKRGHSLAAAEATEIAEYVELLLDLLRAEINELLAPN